MPRAQLHLDMLRRAEGRRARAHVDIGAEAAIGDGRAGAGELRERDAHQRLEGPGLVACDGDRERALSPGQPASLRVERDGPYVIDAGRALAAAAADGIYLDRTHWHDRRDGTGFDCC